MIRPHTRDGADLLTSLYLGAHYASDGKMVIFRVRAPAATRVELWTFAEPMDVAPRVHEPMHGPADGLFQLTLATASLVEGDDTTIYYGYRAFGPNWRYDPAWTPGSAQGFVCDVDAVGNRFNPNKLLLDPYAREVSHCAQTPQHPDRSAYFSGDVHRCEDTAAFAPKGIVLRPSEKLFGDKPSRAFKDEIIYEVHVRGFTMADMSLPPELRGTYAGAARRASYLAGLGITAVEFLPVHQTQNALNDDLAFAKDHNYWGYQTMAYFAPDRRYATDQTPGGPTAEWRAMVKAFHDCGLKVYIDVVYNHHEEGGVDPTGQIGTIYSLRGLDNAGYYEDQRASGHAEDYENETGVGPNINAATPIVRDLVVDSLRYWADELGVDGFRFDLAAVLGNAKTEGGYAYVRDDPDGILTRATRTLPVRTSQGGAGVDLIAEPYAVSMDAQEQGNFPLGWAEWNDRFRDVVRASQNKLDVVDVTPGALAMRLAGSQDLFGRDGRRPWASVNYITCHDGLTLNDLHSYAAKRNAQPYPFGPSDGGRSTSDEMCWDHGGDVGQQAQAIRTSLALLMVAAGVPMIEGGSELNRTQYGNNNAYNLDTSANWLDWTLLTTQSAQVAFTRHLISFRRLHPALRPIDFFKGAPHTDGAIKDITWLTADGDEIGPAYFENPSLHFIAWQIDGAPTCDPASRIYIAYNGWHETITAALPELPTGQIWLLAIDTSARAADWDNAVAAGFERALSHDRIEVDGRSCVVAIAKAITTF